VKWDTKKRYKYPSAGQCSETRAVNRAVFLYVGQHPDAMTPFIKSSRRSFILGI